MGTMEYVQECGYNYLKIRQEGPFDYRLKMLLQNSLKGFLKMEFRQIDEEAWLCTRIGGLQSLRKGLEQEKLGERQLSAFFESLEQACAGMEEYLLPFDGLILDPDHIYVRVNGSWDFFWVYGGCGLPDTGGLDHLLSYLLDHLDFADRDGTAFLYTLYQAYQNGNGGLEALREQYRMMLSGRGWEEELVRREAERQGKETGWRAGEYRKEEGTKAEGTKAGGTKAGGTKAGGTKVGGTKAGGMQVGGTKAGGTQVGGTQVSGTQVGGMKIGGKKVSGKKGEGKEWEEKGDEKREGRRGGRREKAEPKLGDRRQDTGQEISGRRERYGNGTAGRIRSSFSQWEQVQNHLIERVKGMFGGLFSHAADPQEQEEEQGEYVSQPTTLLTGAMINGGIYCLRAKNGAEEDILLSEFPFFVGKAEKNVDYVLEDGYVSRFHARIDREEERFWLTDLNSTNGTFLNRERLVPYERTEIKEGDRIVFAHREYEFSFLF